MIQLMRLEGWPERLAAFLHERHSMPFEWGRNDCVMFAAGSVEAITGVSLLPDYTWSDAAEAEDRLKRAGGLKAIVDQRLPRLKNLAYTRRGDIVMLKISAASPDARAVRPLSVFDGDHCLSPGPKGLMRNRLAEVGVFAWSVGSLG
jgi:hypothetical protein